jgi:uncharacterized RDD family membrane protein YckC
VVTGEAVGVDLRIARLGSRTIAALIDLVIEVGVVIALVFAVPAVVGGGAYARGWIGLVAGVAAFVGYPVACETLWRGRTLGKAAMGLRVARDDGGPPRFRHALVRGLAGVMIEKPGPLLALPAIITMMVSRRSQRLGDVLAGTVVLQERLPRATGYTPTMPPGLTDWAALLDLSRLDDFLALAVRGFLSRQGELSPVARTSLAETLAMQVAAVVTPPPPPGTPEPAYLAAVLAERTSRSRARLEAAAVHRMGSPAGTTGWDAGWEQWPGPPPAVPVPPVARTPATPVPPAEPPETTGAFTPPN